MRHLSAADAKCQTTSDKASVTCECRDARLIQLGRILITPQSISDARLQQQLIAKLSQVDRVTVVKRCCLLLHLECLLQDQAVATTLHQVNHHRELLTRRVMVKHTRLMLRLNLVYCTAGCVAQW